MSEASVTFSNLERLVKIMCAAAQDKPDIDRRLRLWMSDCAARAFYIVKQGDGNYRCLQNAITDERQYARGEIDGDGIKFRDGTVSIVREAGWNTNVATVLNLTIQLARAISDNKDGWVFCAIMSTAGDIWVSSVDEYGESNTETLAAEGKWQFERLVARLSDPEPDDWPLPDPPATDKAA